MVAKANLLGQRFGRLLVVEPAPSRKGRGYWMCECTCGAKKLVSSSALTRGTSKSCGCLVVDTSRAKALRNQIGGYKGYRKYRTVEDYLSNTAPNGWCLEWKGALHNSGYPKVVRHPEAGTSLGHRVVFFLTHGAPMPAVVRHTCDNPKCLNPAHLLGGTTKDNIADRIARKRDTHNRKLTEEDVREIRSLYKSGVTSPKLATQFSVSKQTILSIVNFKIWKHVCLT